MEWKTKKNSEKINMGHFSIVDMAISFVFIVLTLMDRSGYYKFQKRVFITKNLWQFWKALFINLTRILSWSNSEGSSL